MTPKGFPITALDLARIVYGFVDKHFEPIAKELNALPLDRTQDANANAFFDFMSCDVDADLPKLPLSTLRLVYSKLIGFMASYGMRENEVIWHVPFETSKKELLARAFRELLPRTEPSGKKPVLFQ